MSAATGQSGPTEEVLGSSDPPGERSVPPDPTGVGLASSDPPGEDSASPDPWGSDPLLGVEDRSRKGPAPPQPPQAHAPDTKKGEQVHFPWLASVTGHPCEQVCFPTACDCDGSSPWTGMPPRGLRL
jgi:hypothetical protein